MRGLKSYVDPEFVEIVLAGTGLVDGKQSETEADIQQSAAPHTHFQPDSPGVEYIMKPIAFIFACIFSAVVRQDVFNALWLVQEKAGFQSHVQ